MSGVISDTGTLEKTGNGTLKLSGSNSYGLNHIYGGILSGNSIADSGTNSAFGQGSFVINNGAKRLVVAWTDPLGNSQKSIHFSTALMLGLIRDDLPFDQVLTGDNFYVGDPKISSRRTFRRSPPRCARSSSPRPELENC